GAHDLRHEEVTGRPGVVYEVEADGVGDVGEPRRPGVVVSRWFGSRPGAAEEQAACQDDQAAHQDKQVRAYPGQPNGPHGCVPPREDELTDGAERVTFSAVARINRALLSLLVRLMPSALRQRRTTPLLTLRQCRITSALQPTKAYRGWNELATEFPGVVRPHWKRPVSSPLE